MAWDGKKFDLPSHWPEVRRRCLRRDPICRICEVAPSTTVDHVVNRASTDRDWSRIRLRDHLELVQGLCKGCHDRKSNREAQAARAKSQAVIRERTRRPAERHPGLRG